MLCILFKKVWPMLPSWELQSPCTLPQHCTSSNAHLQEVIKAVALIAVQHTLYISMHTPLVYASGCLWCTAPHTLVVHPASVSHCNTCPDHGQTMHACQIQRTVYGDAGPTVHGSLICSASSLHVRTSPFAASSARDSLDSDYALSTHQGSPMSSSWMGQAPALGAQGSPVLSGASHHHHFTPCLQEHGWDCHV